MRYTRTALAVIAALSVVAACGDESSDGTGTLPPTTVASTTVASTTVPETTVPVTTVPVTTVPVTTVPVTTVPVTTVPAAPIVALWPAADVVFTTPEAAAQDFVDRLLGVGAVLGPFAAGDQRSGEIEVFASVDGAPIGDARSTLLLRQLGPADGWFVIGAASAVATIAEPQAGATVAAGPVTVSGLGTGFEATIVVSASIAGRPGSELDRTVAMAGNLGEALPYSVTLDLSAAKAGDVVILLVRGGAGLETDPGDFGAIPVVIG